jgi:predicted Zn-dependent protease
MIERLISADTALADGRYQEAERAFAQVVGFDPHNTMARVGLARVSLALGRWDEARTRLDEALALDPDDALAGRLLADLEARMPRAHPGARRPEPTMPEPRGLLDRLLRRDRRP